MLLHLCAGIASVDSSVGWKMSVDHPLHVLMALLLPSRRERGRVREGQVHNWSGSPLLLSNLNYYIVSHKYHFYIHICSIRFMFSHWFLPPSTFFLHLYRMASCKHLQVGNRQNYYISVTLLK